MLHPDHNDREDDTLLPLEKGAHKKTQSYFWPFIVSVIAHTMFGIQPVIGRYLQKTWQLQPFTILFFSFASLTVIYSPRILLKFRQLNQISKKALFGFILCIIITNTTKMYSTRYTKAVYVQLINLCVPFIVSFFAYFLLSERITLINILFILFTIMGGIMVIFGGVAVESHSEILNLTDNDWIGIGLSFVTAFFTALYLIIVKSASSNSESLIMIQLMSGLMYCIPSVVFQESWKLMWDLDQHGWIMFACFALSYLIGVSCNIYAIGKIGAATVSSLLSWRIVVSVVASWLILNETFTSLWQYVGSGIVVIAVTGTFASKRLDPLVKSTMKAKSK